MPGLPPAVRPDLHVWILLLMLAGPLLLAGCGDNPTGPELSGDDLLQLVMVSNDLQLLEDIVESIALNATLRSESDLTFFAPTDEALRGLGPDMLTQLNDPANRDVLRKLIRRHLVPGRFRAVDLRDGTRLDPLEGPPLEVRVSGETITVGGAEITEFDFETGNGVLHQVDEVVRDHLTLAERLRVTPLINTFANVLDTAGLEGLLQSGEPYTLLIPINSAFAALDAAEFQSLLHFQHRDILLKVLRHHVLPGRVRVEQLADGSALMPLDGTPLAVESSGNLTYLGGSRIIVPEVETSDGLIYLIDAVVLGHLDLAERLQIAPQHTLFYQILQDAGLLDQLRGDGSFTIFAPTDATLESLGDRFIPELRQRPDLLLRTAQYQVVPGRIEREDLLTGGTLTTLGGYDLPVSTVDDGITKVFLGNRGLVSFPPKDTRNGLFYSIAPFLIPPEVNLEERAVFAALYRFLDLMQDAGLTSLLHEEGPYTVFAPTDAALAGRTFPPSVIQEIVKHHFVSGEYSVGELQQAAPISLATLAGSEIAITYDPFAGLFIGGLKASSVNNRATNGIIHGLGGVLSPPP